MTINKELAQQVVDFGVKMVKEGLVTGTGGNISVRVPGEEAFLLTPSGMPYEQVTVADIVKVNFEGEKIEGKRRASVERNLHRYIYKQRDDVNAVVHTHSNYASAFSTLRQDMDPILDPAVCVFGEKIPTSEYARIGTEQLAINVAKVLGNSSGAFIANHGCVGVGPNLELAYGSAEFLEACSISYFAAKSVGEPHVIDEESVKKTMADMDESYGQPDDDEDKLGG